MLRSGGLSRRRLCRLEALRARFVPPLSRPDRRLPRLPPRAPSLHLLGLSGRALAPRRRVADRSLAAVATCGRPGRRLRHRQETARARSDPPIHHRSGANWRSDLVRWSANFGLAKIDALGAESSKQIAQLPWRNRADHGCGERNRFARSGQNHDAAYPSADQMPSSSRIDQLIEPKPLVPVSSSTGKGCRRLRRMSRMAKPSRRSPRMPMIATGAVNSSKFLNVNRALAQLKVERHFSWHQTIRPPVGEPGHRPPRRGCPGLRRRAQAVPGATLDRPPAIRQIGAAETPFATQQAMPQATPDPTMQRMRTMPGLSEPSIPQSVDRAIDDRSRAAGNELRRSPKSSCRQSPRCRCWSRRSASAWRPSRLGLGVAQAEPGQRPCSSERWIRVRPPHRLLRNARPSDSTNPAGFAQLLSVRLNWRRTMRMWGSASRARSAA